MAEETLVLTDLPRAEAYERLERHLELVLEDVTDEIARMATVACVLHHGLGLLWTGFYRTTRPGLLEVGPYQGTLGCLSIAFGRGVCGTAAAEARAVVVPDVRTFPGHITCDGRALSEIVVPVLGSSGEVRAVLDLDASWLDAFSDEDVAPLERIVQRFVA